MPLAEGHKAVTPVRLEPEASWSQVKHSTTEPLRSLATALKNGQYDPFKIEITEKLI